MTDFVHLHVHTEYSLLDGACRIKELIARAKELEQSAVAITDHGVMFGAIDFYKEAKKQGIKPIIGCEVYVAPRTRFDKVHKIDNSPYHLVLLCKNETGYQNLIKLVSQGFTDGFYFKPRIDLEILKKHSEGLICLSACLAGEIPRQLREGNYEAAKETALIYQEIFGAENYYIEIQNHGIKEQIQILPQLIRISRETGIGLVATNDSHYIEKADSRMQKVLICIQTNHTMDEDSDLEFETEEFYIKSGDEMASLFSSTPDAISNTVKIAQMCNLDFEFGVHKLPLFVAPNGEDNISYFKRLCYEGMYRYYGENPEKTVVDRLEYELSVIIKMGYVDYYLIVFDFIDFAKKHGIAVGPGRGSGAGSLAAYCIGITGIDPMKYNLLFERFLNPERVSMPDFDIDFCYERRQEVINYVIEKYGADHVAQIITFGTMAARGAIRDVGRALGVGYQSVDQIAKQIPMEIGMTIEKALRQSKDLMEEYESSEQVRELIDMSKKVEGMPRHASTHAAGVVITRNPVDSYVPLSKNDEAVVTQYTMTTLEELGLLKMDFLGLRNLTIIQSAEQMIQKHTPDFSMENISLEDEESFQMLSRGHSLGVFQFESAGMRQVLVQLKPESVEDLIAVISLYRPGPMDSIGKYIQNRHNTQKITYKHPLLRDILDVTYGCIVYQEQVMQICQRLAGYSYGHADIVRRAMSKKKADVMEKERHKFIYGEKREDGSVACIGCVANGVSEKIANEIFDEMSSFASYAFNKSHAAAYAMVSYQTAYLKCHYKTEYMAALLTSILDNTDKVIGYINECSELNIKILPPDVNKSRDGFQVEDGGIRFGLLAIKNLGRGFIRDLIAQREEGGDYQSFSDLCQRLSGKDLNRRSMESLIKSGSLDGFGHNRHEMLMGYPALLSDIDQSKKNNVEGQLNLFDTAKEQQSTTSYVLPVCEEYPISTLLSMEKETLGLYVSGHPLSEYDALRKKLSPTNISDILAASNEETISTIKDGVSVHLLCIISLKKVKSTKSGDTMAFLTIEDMTGSMEMLVFPKILANHKELVNETQIILVDGRVSIREDEDAKIICERIFSPDEVLTAKEKVTASAAKNTNTKPGLYLKVPSKDSALFLKAQKYLRVFEGTFPVYVLFEDTKKLAVAPKNLWIDYNEPLHRQLGVLLGKENVAYVHNDKTK